MSEVKVPKKAKAVKAKPRAKVVVTVVTEEEEYTDEQFYADIKKAGPRFDEMIQKALEDEAAGRTREFPV